MMTFVVFCKHDISSANTISFLLLFANTISVLLLPVNAIPVLLLSASTISIFLFSANTISFLLFSANTMSVFLLLRIRYRFCYYCEYDIGFVIIVNTISVLLLL
jgi:hypothetical protein